MELPRMKKLERGGMLDGIKSKLGFADANSGRNDDPYYDDYDEDYGEYGDYGDSYDDDEPVRGGAASSRYDSYAPVTTRSARGTSSGTSARSSRSSDDGFPKLVSIDDVRAHTQVPESLKRDPLPPRRSSALGGYRGERTVVDATTPAPSSPAHNAALKERSEGLDSLFTPSSTAQSSEAGFSSAASLSKVAAATAAASAPATASSSSSFDPYEAYAGSGSTAHNPARAITVLKPASYGEVERVAKILKSGDAVVLSLRNTPDQLSKRILDFSFGVSSALDASVECVADKVFAITRVNALSEAERLALRNQGVL